MDARRAGFKRIAGVDHRRQLDDFDLDCFGAVFGLRRRRRNHRRNRLADKTHDILRQDRLFDRLIVELMQHRPDRPHAHKVGCGINPRACRRRDADNAAGRDGAADKAHPVRGGKVGGEVAAARHQRWIFQPPDGAADPCHPGAGGCVVHASVVQSGWMWNVRGAGANQASKIFAASPEASSASRVRLTKLRKPGSFFFSAKPAVRGS